MEEEDFKWYSPFVLLVGAILSFADPITDILTLVEFYRADHMTWFGVGLTFILLPCLAFPVAYREIRVIERSLSQWARTALCALHPFSAAFARLEALFHCLKNWWYKDEIDSHSDSHDFSKAEDVLSYISFAVLFEAVLECAPQFIIQLYAIIVQEEPAAIIQIISLPISFLTLAWAFTATDKMVLAKCEIIPSSGAMKVKHQLALYVTHLLLLSSRLFAICYFTVSYKWWVIGVVMFHSCVVLIATVIQKRDEVDRDALSVFFILLFMGIHSLRDDLVELSMGLVLTGVTMSMYLSHILFVLENFFMILTFYFTYNPNAWYSLPVTVSVCVFSVLGSTMRICLFRWLSRRPAGQLSGRDDSSNVNTDHVSSV
ncbi:XK-related protein 6-like [Pocillopora verrucosa]|uniref:XK-related protein 6-like n=1 Tax=Pocillopora verrucosa TaxID=203993 RepID=UPI00333E30C0